MGVPDRVMGGAWGSRGARRRGSALVCAASAALLCLGLSACGGVANDAVVVRVGDVAITKATVDHWTVAISRNGAFDGFREAPRGSAEQRALALLISSQWLIGEAARLGVSESDAAIDEALGEREREGKGFQQHLHAVGLTLADVKLQMRAEFASEAIRELLASRASKVSQREVADFYRANRHMFDKPEERVTDLLENLPSPSAATALVKRIGTGRRFAHLAYLERVSRSPSYLGTPEKVRVVDAIFAARPGVASDPIRLNHSWTVFVVRKVVPATPQPLAKVRGEVVKALNVSRQHEIATTFSMEYEARWRAKTSCKAGFLGSGCPQKPGPLGPYEDPFSRRAHPLLSEQAAISAG